MSTPFVEDIADKIANDETLTPQDKSDWRDWFRDASGKLAGLFGGTNGGGNINQVSQITPDLGTMYAGDFIAPASTTESLTPTDSNADLSFVSANGWTFGGVKYKFGSVLRGVLGWGANELGQLLAGAGAVILDAMGITIIVTTGANDSKSYKFSDGTNVISAFYSWFVSNTNYSSIGSNSIAGRDSVVSITADSPAGRVSQVGLETSVDGATNGEVTVTNNAGTSQIIIAADAVSLSGVATAQTPSSGDNSTKIATTAFVVATQNNFDIKLAVRAASQSNLAFTRSANVYTATSLGVLLKATIDSGWSTGAALAVGDRILLANQTNSVDNGIVTITNLGTIGTNAVLTRATDMDVNSEVTAEMRVPVTEGTDANIDYKLSSAGPFTLNTTALPFTRAGGPPTGAAGGDLSGTYPNPSVAASAITLSKMANMATSSLIYRKTAGTGAPEVNTLSTLITDIRATLDSIYQLVSAKDATGGYAGLTLFKINFKNAANTFTSFFTNANTAARTYTFKDADGTVAFTSDITGTNSGTNTGDVTLGAQKSGLSLSGQVLSLAPTGWTEANETWTRVSASTMTSPTDTTARYKKGTLLKWTDNSTVHYAVLATDSTFAAGVTTLTIIVNMDHVIGTGGISANFYSYSTAPLGWPGWFNYAPAPTGYTATVPTNAVYRYCPIGSVMKLAFSEGTVGVSNATTKTYQAPVNSANISNAKWNGSFVPFDNGANKANGAALLSANSKTINMYLSTYAAWTNTGNALINQFFMDYEW